MRGEPQQTLRFLFLLLPQCLELRLLSLGSRGLQFEMVVSGDH